MFLTQQMKKQNVYFQNDGRLKTEQFESEYQIYEMSKKKINRDTAIACSCAKSMNCLKMDELLMIYPVIRKLLNELFESFDYLSPGG